MKQHEHATSKRAQRWFRWFNLERRFDGSQHLPVGGNLPRLGGDRHLRQSHPLIREWE